MSTPRIVWHKQFSCIPITLLLAASILVILAACNNSDENRVLPTQMILPEETPAADPTPTREGFPTQVPEPIPELTSEIPLEADAFTAQATVDFATFADGDDVQFISVLEYLPEENAAFVSDEAGTMLEVLHLGADDPYIGQRIILHGQVVPHPDLPERLAIAPFAITPARATGPDGSDEPDTAIMGDLTMRPVMLDIILSPQTTALQTYDALSEALDDVLDGLIWTSASADIGGVWHMTFYDEVSETLHLYEIFEDGTIIYTRDTAEVMADQPLLPIERETVLVDSDAAITAAEASGQIDMAFATMTLLATEDGVNWVFSDLADTFTMNAGLSTA